MRDLESGTGEAVAIHGLKNDLISGPVIPTVELPRIVPSYVTKHPELYLPTPLARFDIAGRYGSDAKTVADGLRHAVNYGPVHLIHGMDIESGRHWISKHIERDSKKLSKSFSPRTSVFYLGSQEDLAKRYATRVAPLGYNEIEVLQTLESKQGTIPVRVLQKELAWEEAKVQAAINVLKDARLVKIKDQEKVYEFQGKERKGKITLCSRIPISELK